MDALEPQPGPREWRRASFGAATALGGLTIAAYSGRGPLAPLGPSPSLAAVLFGTALIVAGLAWLAPERTGGLYAVLIALGRGQAYLTLLVFFFGVLTPAGLLARLVGYDPMQRGSRRESYWRPHRARDKSSYFHQS